MVAGDLERLVGEAWLLLPRVEVNPREPSQESGETSRAAWLKFASEVDSEGQSVFPSSRESSEANLY